MMKQKNHIPGVDAEALSELAKQFPPVTAKNDDRDPAGSATSAPPVVREIRRGGGFATFVALMALVVAAGAVAWPVVRPEVAQRFGHLPLVARMVALTDVEAARDKRMAALESQMRAAVQRVEAVEPRIVASAERAAQLETRLAAIRAAAPAEPGAPVAADGRLEAFEQELVNAMGRIAAAEARLESAMQRLQAIDPTGTEIGDLRTRLTEVEDRGAGQAAAVGALERTAREHGTSLAGQAAGLDVASGGIAGLDKRLTQFEAMANTRHQDLQARAEANAARLATLETSAGEGLARLSGRLDGLATSLATAESTLAAAGEALKNLDAANVATTERLAAADDKLAAAVAAVAEGGAAAAAAVEERLTTVSAAIDEKLTGALAAVEERVTAIAAATDEKLAAATAATDEKLAATVAATDDRVAGVRDDATAARAFVDRSKLALALLQLNAVAETHKPFEREIATARVLADARPDLVGELDLMREYAASGVATVTELRDSFSVILMPKLHALASNLEKPWTERVRGWLTAVIAPQTTEPDPNPVVRNVTAAIEHLAADDLQAAVEQLSRLEGPAAAITTRWLVEAKARQIVERGRAVAGAAILELLASGN